MKKSEEETYGTQEYINKDVFCGSLQMLPLLFQTKTTNSWLIVLAAIIAKSRQKSSAIIWQYINILY